MRFIKRYALFTSGAIFGILTFVGFDSSTVESWFTNPSSTTQSTIKPILYDNTIVSTVVASSDVNIGSDMLVTVPELYVESIEAVESVDNTLVVPDTVVVLDVKVGFAG